MNKGQLNAAATSWILAVQKVHLRSKFNLDFYFTLLELNANLLPVEYPEYEDYIKHGNQANQQHFINSQTGNILLE